jgi:hypothetical protein
MNSQDVIRISYNAKSETEAFINRYLNDQAKGWPRVCLFSPVYAGYPQSRQAELDLHARARQQ